MAVQFKSGVTWTPSQALEWARGIAESIFASLGVTLVITSGNDGMHMAGSRHYSNDAMDLRRRDLDAKGKTGAAVNQLRSQLGNAYDVVLESDHIHVEYDPKEKVNATLGTLAGISLPLLAVLGVGLILSLRR